MLSCGLGASRKRMIEIKAHFDGSFIVPDEPLDLPLDKQFVVRIDAAEDAGADPGKGHDEKRGLAASSRNALKKWLTENPF